MNPTFALQLTDAKLMQEVQAGGRHALGELYDRFSVRAYRTALSVCRDSESAQDAVQDAFIAMWSSRATYEPARGSVERWAMSIVRYRAIALSRRRDVAARQDQAAGTLNEQRALDDVPSDFTARADTERLTGLLAQLPPAQREVIQLGFYDGLTHLEIARRLALPHGTVKGRMRLGLNKLRSEIDRPGQD